MADVQAAGSPAGTAASAVGTMPTWNLIPAHTDNNITNIIMIIIQGTY